MTLNSTPATRKPRKSRRNPLAPTADDIRTGFRLDHQFSNARIEELETAAQAADLAHDVAQASTDSDVVAALAALPEVTTPDYIWYSVKAHGFVYGSQSRAYNTYTDAANARDFDIRR